jgi:hypothetical protein
MRQSVMYSNSLVRTETDGIYISINVEIATEGICRGAETTQNLTVQVNAVCQQMVRACVRACPDSAAEGAIYDY